MEVEDEGAPEVEGEGYPGGPLDETLLTGYKDHVMRIHITMCPCNYGMMW